jgi:hypothetical protein
MRRCGRIKILVGVIGLVCLGLLIGFAVGWHCGSEQIKMRCSQTIENLREMMLASRIYQLAYSNNPADVTQLLTNQPVSKP